MVEPVYHALLDQKKSTGQFEFVFCNAAGNPLNVNNVTKRVWYALLRLLNLNERHPYQARHTRPRFGSLMVKTPNGLPDNSEIAPPKCFSPSIPATSPI